MSEEEGLHNHTENAEKLPGALDKDAAIYNHPEEKTGREQMKELHGKEKRTYFMDYFARTVVIVIIVAALVGYFIYSQVTSPDYAMDIMVIDGFNTGDTDFQDSYFNTFLEEHDINSKKNTVGVNANIYPEADDSQAQLGALEVIFTRFAAQQVDLCFSDNLYFDQMSPQGYFLDLRDCLTQEEYDQLLSEDRIVYTQLTEEDEYGDEYVPEGAEELPVGVLLDADSGWLGDAGWYVEGQDPVIGISCVARDMDLTMDMFREIVFG